MGNDDSAVLGLIAVEDASKIEETEQSQNFPKVLEMSVRLENHINELLQVQTALIQSLKLNKWIIEDDDTPISFKIRALRFSKAIDDNTLSDLLTLFKIRNVYAHNRIGSLKFKDVSKRLNELKLKSVQNMTNTQEKFEKTYYHYIRLLFRKANITRQRLTNKGIKFKIAHH